MRSDDSTSIEPVLQMLLPSVTRSTRQRNYFQIPLPSVTHSTHAIFPICTLEKMARDANLAQELSDVQAGNMQKMMTRDAQHGAAIAKE